MGEVDKIGDGEDGARTGVMENGEVRMGNAEQKSGKRNHNKLKAHLKNK